MTKLEIMAELRANPDKIFYILKRDGFAGAKIIWGKEWINIEVAFYANNIQCYGKFISEDETKYIAEMHVASWQYHIQQLALEPDELSYIERFAGEVEG